MSIPPPPPPPSGSFPQQPPGWQQGGQVPPQPPGFQVYPAGGPMAAKQGNSGMAIASFVCSLVGLIPCFWLFQIMGVLGMIFGFVGLKQTKSGERGGRGLALAGVIIGIVLVLACIAVWVYLVGSGNCVRTGNSFDCSTN